MNLWADRRVRPESYDKIVAGAKANRCEDWQGYSLWQCHRPHSEVGSWYYLRKVLWLTLPYNGFNSSAILVGVYFVHLARQSYCTFADDHDRVSEHLHEHHPHCKVQTDFVSQLNTRFLEIESKMIQPLEVIDPIFSLVILLEQYIVCAWCHWGYVNIPTWSQHVCRNASGFLSQWQAKVMVITLSYSCLLWIRHLSGYSQSDFQSWQSYLAKMRCSNRCNVVALMSNIQNTIWRVGYHVQWLLGQCPA